MKNTLARLVQEKLNATGLSIRAAAREIGVSHTTLGRALSGEAVDLPTVTSISQWLGVDTATLLNAGAGDLANDIAAFIELKPQLAPVFAEAIRRIEIGELDAEALNDVVRYVKFRFEVE